MHMHLTNSKVNDFLPLSVADFLEYVKTADACVHSSMPCMIVQLYIASMCVPPVIFIMFRQSCVRSRVR